METHYDPAPVREWAAANPFNTLPQLLDQAFRRHAAGPRPFLGAKVDGSYRFQTYDQVRGQIRQFAAALIQLGIQPGERVAQISGNRPEWVVTDFGIAHAGAVHVPLYPTLGEDGIEYILRDCGARLVVVATPKHLEAVLAADTAVEHIVCLFPPEGQSARKLWSYADFLRLGGEPGHEAEIERRCQALQPTDIASLVYTSGTTGEPKGAMLMHGNFCSNALTCVPLLGFRSDDLELSFLPLSHVFERIAYYCLVSVGAAIAYAESFDTVGANMKEVRPTVVPSVPRVFEKIQGRILAKMEKAHPVRRALFDWAVATGVRHWHAKQRGTASNLLKLQYASAYKLVLQKLHQETGGRIRIFCSGGAPLRREVGEFFLGAGFNLVEGYGLTETTPVITLPPPGRPRLRTVGKPIPAVQVRLAQDGEIQVKGPNIMLGYFNKPEASAEAIDADGWFATGDIGMFDEEGYLAITDRKKDILVMSNGKNVAPQPIEQKIQASPFIEQAVVLGDNRKFVAALIVPSYANLKKDWSASPEQLVEDPRFKEFMQAEVDKQCADFSAYERVKAIALLPRELSQETGELTPKLSVKRKVVNAKFAEQISALYPED